ncbi:type IA DNA topoisomerase [Halobacillus karajensis]|uniref:DNA topoisomerase n=1 Tax=Halobacillus karajensis TaxID=195088 RepID=A0A024P458_9BACI|nr:type IA DNA topoisomerase [Halobacillus karajensis]CDQ20701.1 DNA topoisomerase 3 [Halobacillus karajensis]CDQ23829.1 DNA topoisomerase 3 [Halobacillus karajensis]CDQ27307.1 DNA topoisomerase 3 [Halobacillus karajensis]
MRVVILAEKPSQAKAYAEAFTIQEKTKTYILLKPDETFPNGATITWGVGHLVELKEPHDYKSEWKRWKLDQLPIVPDQFLEKVSKGKWEQFQAVKRLFQQADILVNAADVDREGSNIFYSILSLTGVKGKPVRRLWINSLEKDEVRKGFKHLQDNDKDLRLFDEAKARQISDWMVGINASRLFTLLLQKKGFSSHLTIGRVQSPTVYLIYQRHKEIENFISEPFYQIEGLFHSESGAYKGLAKIKEKDKAKVQALMEEYGLKEKEDLTGVVQRVDRKTNYQKSPKLHSLSTLQSIANRRWKYTPSQVLKTMQKLYEKRLVSYPRTDCNYITESEFSYLVNNLESYQKTLKVSFTPVSLKPNKRYVDSRKVQEHYAIIPTKSIPTEKRLSSLSREESNIYKEVLATTLAMFHGDYVYEETAIFTHVHDLPFKSTGRREVKRGWKELFPKPPKSKQEKEALLPQVQKGENVGARLYIKESMTQPPKPYTEGQLINMMKTCGKLMDDEEDVEILKEVEGLGTEATRSSIIETIKTQKYIEVKKNNVYVTAKGVMLCEAIEGTLLSSPSMTAKWESYLKKIGSGEGSKQMFIKQTNQFIEKLIQETPGSIQQVHVRDTGEKKKWNAPIAKCPACSKGFIMDRYKFYACSDYKEGCKVSFPKKLAGKTLTNHMIKALCEKKRTRVLKGFKGKKTFSTALILDEEYKIKFDFAKKA